MRTFASRVIRIEEQFETVIRNPQAYGEAQSENKSKEATERVSKGWWVSFEGFGVAFYYGSTKPDLIKGDVVYIDVRKQGE